MSEQGIAIRDHQGLSIPHLAYLTFESITEVVLVSVTGFICAYTGMLPKQGQKTISMLNVDIFTPALIFSKLAKSLSVAKFLEISIIPFFYALTTGISYIAGKTLATIFKLDIDETNFVIANSIFGNSNSLPVSLTLSLAYTLPGLTWDDIENDNRDNVASRGILYLLIFQQIGQVVRWSVGANKLLKWSGESQSSIDHGYDSAQSSTAPSSVGSLVPGAIENGDNDAGNNGLLYVDMENNTLLGKLWNSMKRAFAAFTHYMNPPLYAMLFSVIVASVHPVQHAFFHKNGFINNTVSAAITELGSLSIPLILIVLGSNLNPTNETAPKSYNYNKLVCCSIFGRMILPSLILLPTIALSVKYVKISILDDPIFLVVGFILTIAPPAIQLTQITQMNEFFEAEMAGVLFWGYCILTLPVTIAIVISAIGVLKWSGN